MSDTQGLPWVFSIGGIPALLLLFSLFVGVLKLMKFVMWAVWIIVLFFWHLQDALKISFSVGFFDFWSFSTDFWKSLHFAWFFVNASFVSFDTYKKHLKPVFWRRFSINGRFRSIFVDKLTSTILLLTIPFRQSKGKLVCPTSVVLNERFPSALRKGYPIPFPRSASSSNPDLHQSPQWVLPDH